MKLENTGSKMVCLACLRKAVGKEPDSLTWFFAVCWWCYGHEQPCTKVLHLPRRVVEALKEPATRRQP